MIPEEEIVRLRTLCRESGHALSNHLTVILGQIAKQHPDFIEIEGAANRCAVISRALVDAVGFIPHYQRPDLDETKS